MAMPSSLLPGRPLVRNAGRRRPSGCQAGIDRGKDVFPDGRAERFV